MALEQSQAQHQRLTVEVQAHVANTGVSQSTAAEGAQEAHRRSEHAELFATSAVDQTMNEARRDALAAKQAEEGTQRCQ